MPKFFVNKNDHLDIEVYVWDSDEGVDATWDKGQIPPAAKPESVMFTFKRPNYADSTAIIQQAQIGGNDVGINVTSFQDIILRRLCVDWTITDEDGEKAKITTANFNNLEPRIARAAVDGLLQKVKF